MTDPTASGLDAASLFRLFTNLQGKELGRCSCVCRAWRCVAASEVLWQQLSRQLQPEQLIREDILEAMGSYREYYAWLQTRICRPVNCLCSLTEDHLGHAQITLAEVTRLDGTRAEYKAHNVHAVPAPSSQAGGSVSKPTWSPVGGLVAYSCVQPGRFSVTVVNSQGQQLGELLLNDPPGCPAFYLHWAPCGTRLLMLSDWPSGLVALRAWDLGPLLLRQQKVADNGRQQCQAGKAGSAVLLSTSRPLFLTCSPTSTRVLWHGDMQHYGLADCATTVDEDGAEHDRILSSPFRLNGARVPQWLRDTQGREWLLLVVGVPGFQEEQESEAEGELLMLSVDAMEEAYESSGSRLTADLVRRISTKVCSIGDTYELRFAANVSGSIVAMSTRGLAIQYIGRPEQLFLDFLTDGQFHDSEVEAIQWSPDGRKLAVLIGEGPSWFWMIWHAPEAALRYQPGDGNADAGLGCVMICQRHSPTSVMQTEYLPFWDQYAQSVQLWSPDNQAFCYAATEEEASPGRESNYIYVQPVPSLEDMLTLDSTASQADYASIDLLVAFSGLEGSDPVRMPVVVGPTASRVMPGSVATWSYTL